MYYVKVIVVYFSFLNFSLALNILAIFNFPARSHYGSFAKLFEGLVDRGHNLTVISHFPRKTPLQKYHDVPLENIESFIKNSASFLSLEQVTFDRSFLYKSTKLVEFAGKKACELTLQSRSFQHFLRQKNHFDLILFEDFVAECLWPLVQKYNVPTISLLPSVLTPWNPGKYGNPSQLAYCPHFHLPYNNKMNFFQRVENVLLSVYTNLIYKYSLTPGQIEIAKKYISVDESAFENRFYNASLALINTHFTLNLPRPYVQNIIEVGGIHIDKPKAVPNVSSYLSTYYHSFDHKYS